MGDILHAMPAVAALRAALPTSQIGWAIKPQWTALLQAESGVGAQAGSPEMPLVNLLHRVPADAWARRPLSIRTLREIAALRVDLRCEKYDVCLDLQGAVRSALIGRMAGAARMVGESQPREPLARWIFSERVATHKAHMIEQAQELVEAFLSRPLTLPLTPLPYDAAVEKECERWLQEKKIKRYVVVNPGAGWGAKRWPAERFGQLAQELAQMGYTVLVNAGPGEDVLAQQVIAASGGRAIAVRGSVGRLIAIMRRASLFVGGDTGPLHLAAALQKPVVGIYGPTDPARNGPFGTHARVLRHPESRRDHTRHQAPEGGLLTIQVSDVLQAAQELLLDEGKMS